MMPLPSHQQDTGSRALVARSVSYRRAALCHEQGDLLRKLDRLSLRERRTAGAEALSERVAEISQELRILERAKWN